MENRQKQISIKLLFLWESIALALLITIQCFAQSYPFEIKKSIYHNGWIDLNKNGKLDPSENPKLPVDERIDDLLSRMDVNEKNCTISYTLW